MVSWDRGVRSLKLERILLGKNRIPELTQNGASQFHNTWIYTNNAHCVYDFLPVYTELSIKISSDIHVYCDRPFMEKETDSESVSDLPKTPRCGASLLSVLRVEASLI